MEIYNEKAIDLLSKDLHTVELFEDKNVSSILFHLNETNSPFSTIEKYIV